MKLLFSSTFLRAMKKAVKREPAWSEILHQTLKLLESDLFHPKLRTHRLKGRLAGSMACSVTYDLRIIFIIVTDIEEEKILLQSIGSHDEVY